MNPINFQQYRNQIETVLPGKGFTLYSETNPTGNYLLIDKFINQPIQQEISGSFIVGGPTLPMIALVHKVTGEVKFIALKLIVPELPLN